MNGVVNKNRIKTFFANNYAWFAAPVFVLLVFIVAEALAGVYPFGKPVIASYDMLAQVAPVIEHYFSVFSGESGLFHTFNLGAGMDVFGILAYCTISPFTPLFLLFGKGRAVYAVSFILPLKVACSAITALWFLNRTFKKIPSAYKAVLAVLYAFSGYLYVANTYIIWVDLMIYMPLVGAGFISLAEKGSVKLFAASLTLMLYACFSITCFSFFTIFPLAVIYFAVCGEKGELNEKIGKVCLSFALAIAAALPVLLPAFFASTSSARNTGLFTRVFSYYTQNQVQNGDINTHLYAKFTYIFSDAIFICLSAVYFLRSKPNDKRARFLFIALLILLFPCLIDESMLLMNMGSYYSYALRFGFLISFYLFYVAARAAEELIEDGGWGKITEKKGAGSYIAAAAAALLAVAAAVAAFLLYDFIASGKADKSPIVDKLEEAFSAGRPFKDFFSAFAHSIGGMETVAPLFLIALLFFIICVVFIKTKLLTPAHIATFICIIALSHSIFYGFSMVRGNRQYGAGEKLDFYTQIQNELESLNDEPFRVKDYDNYVSSDSPLITGVYAHTLFSSIVDKKNMTFPVKYKYGGNTTNSTKSSGGSVFSDALISYKYFVFHTSKENAAKNKIYLKNTGIAVENYRVYENEYAFPTASVVNIGDGKFLDTQDLSAHINGILKAFGEKESEENVKIGVNGLKLTLSRQSDGSYNVKFKFTGQGDLFFNSFFPSDYEIADGRGNYTRYYGFVKLSSSQTVNIRRENGELSEDDIKKYCRAFAVSVSALKAAKKNAESRKVQYKLVKNGFEIEPITAGEGDCLYMNYVDLDGYEIKVNGKKVTPLKNASDFIFVPLESGENKVEITYKSPYIKLILISVAIGAALIALLTLAYKIKPKVFKAICPAAKYAAYALAAVLIAFFYLFPLMVFGYKFFTRYVKWIFKL